MGNKNKIAQQYGWKNWCGVLSDYLNGIISRDIFVALENKVSLMEFGDFKN